MTDTFVMWNVMLCVIFVVYLVIGISWMNHVDGITMKAEQRWLRVLMRLGHIFLWPVVFAGSFGWLFVANLFK